MDKWTVIVELDGAVVDLATYDDIAAAQMAQESKRMKYHHHAKALHKVEVWIKS